MHDTIHGNYKLDSPKPREPLGPLDRKCPLAIVE